MNALEIYWQTPSKQWFRGEILAIHNNDVLEVRRTSPSVSQCLLTWDQLDTFERERVRKHFNIKPYSGF